MTNGSLCGLLVEVMASEYRVETGGAQKSLTPLIIPRHCGVPMHGRSLLETDYGDSYEQRAGGQWHLVAARSAGCTDNLLPLL